MLLSARAALPRSSSKYRGFKRSFRFFAANTATAFIQAALFGVIPRQNKCPRAVTYDKYAPVRGRFASLSDARISRFYCFYPLDGRSRGPRKHHASDFVGQISGSTQTSPQAILWGKSRGPRKHHRRRFCGAKYAGVLLPCLTPEYRGFTHSCPVCQRTPRVGFP